MVELCTDVSAIPKNVGKSVGARGGLVIWMVGECIDGLIVSESVGKSIEE